MSETTDKQEAMQNSNESRRSRRTFLSNAAWALPALYFTELNVTPAMAGPHQDSHTDGHGDVQAGHGDIGHQDQTPIPTQHVDNAHRDVGHVDGWAGGKKYDTPHVDAGHADTPVWPKPHSDTPHGDDVGGHGDGPWNSHFDVPFSDRSA